MPTILTVGHSTKPIAAFLELMKGARVEVVVDVRSRPYSRFNPQYNKQALMAELQQAGIEYEWLGKNLGGLDGNVNFAEAIDDVAYMARHKTVVIMCSEGPHIKCHRNYMLTPEFQAKGVEVLHLQWTGEMVPATPTKVGDTPEMDPLF